MLFEERLFGLGQMRLDERAECLIHRLIDTNIMKLKRSASVLQIGDVIATVLRRRGEPDYTEARQSLGDAVAKAVNAMLDLRGTTERSFADDGSGGIQRYDPIDRRRGSKGQSHQRER